MILEGGGTKGVRGGKRDGVYLFKHYNMDRYKWKLTSYACLFGQGRTSWGVVVGERRARNNGGLTLYIL